MKHQLAQIIYMASIGEFMAMHHGKLLTYCDRMIWPTQTALETDLKSIGVEASPYIVNTARYSTSYTS